MIPEADLKYLLPNAEFAAWQMQGVDNSSEFAAMQVFDEWHGKIVRGAMKFAIAARHELILRGSKLDAAIARDPRIIRLAAAEVQEYARLSNFGPDYYLDVQPNQIYHPAPETQPYGTTDLCVAGPNVTHQTLVDLNAYVLTQEPVLYEPIIFNRQLVRDYGPDYTNAWDKLSPNMVVEYRGPRQLADTMFPVASLTCKQEMVGLRNTSSSGTIFASGAANVRTTFIAAFGPKVDGQTRCNSSNIDGLTARLVPKKGATLAHPRHFVDGVVLDLPTPPTQITIDDSVLHGWKEKLIHTDLQETGEYTGRVLDSLLRTLRKHISIGVPLGPEYVGKMTQAVAWLTPQMLAQIKPGTLIKIYKELEVIQALDNSHEFFNGARTGVAQVLTQTKAATLLQQGFGRYAQLEHPNVNLSYTDGYLTSLQTLSR